MNFNGVKDQEKQKDGKRWLMLLLSFFLAAAIWLLHSLSLDYSVFLEYTVRLESSLEGRSGFSVSDDKLIVRGRAEGYYILKQRIGRPKQITVNASPSVLHLKDSEKNIFYANCEDLKSGIIEALGTNVNVEFIVTNTMDFEFTKIANKRVPVVPATSISFAGQYMPIGNIVLRPDSVDIYGDEKLLSAIDSVRTETISYNKVEAPIQGITELVPIRRIRFSEKNIYYTLNVERYIEESIRITVVPDGVPHGKGMIVLPSEITLKYKRLFGGEQCDAEDFKFVVNYRDFLETIDAKLIPKPVLLPKGVLSYEIEPHFVDCVLFDNRTE